MLTLDMKQRRALKGEIVSILTLRPRRRSVASVLMKHLRAQGWRTTWANYAQFTLLCKRLHLFCYNAIGQSNRIVEFIALDERPATEPDHFEAIGYVIVSGLGWVNRGNPPKTTELNRMARVWRTHKGVVGYCRSNDHALDAIRSTKEIKVDGRPPVAN